MVQQSERASGRLRQWQILLNENHRIRLQDQIVPTILLEILEALERIEARPEQSKRKYERRAK